MTSSVLAPLESEIRPNLQDPKLAHRFFGAENTAVPSLSLEKAWHGLHYLLTGSAWEGDGSLAFLIHGGDLIDLDMTSARVFWPGELAQIDAALSQISPAELRSRFDPRKMMAEEIYPQIWDRDPKEDDALGYVLSCYEELRQFIAMARKEGRCLVVWNEWPAGTGGVTGEPETAASSPSGPKPNVLPLVILGGFLFAIVGIASLMGRRTVIGAGIVLALILLFVAAKFFGVF